MTPERLVKIIGTTWLVVGILGCLAALGRIFMAIVLGTDTALGSDIRPSQVLLWQDLISRFFWQTVAIQGACFAFIGVAAGMLRRRKPWARVAIQGVSVLFLGFGVVFGVWALTMIARFESTTLPEGMISILQIVMLGSGIVVICLYIIVFGGTAWLLSRASVRSLFFSKQLEVAGPTTRH